MKKLTALCLASVFALLAACATGKPESDFANSFRAFPPINTRVEKPFFTDLPLQFVKPHAKAKEKPYKRSRPKELTVSLENFRHTKPLTISINAQNATIGNLAALIAETSGRPIIVEAELSSKVSAPFFLENVRWQDALNALVQVNGSVASINGEQLLKKDGSNLSYGDTIAISQFDTLLARQEKLIKAGGAALTIAEQQRKTANELAEAATTRETAAIITKSYRFRYADPVEAMNYLETLFITFDKETTKSESQNALGVSEFEYRGNLYASETSASNKRSKEKSAFIRSRKPVKSGIRFAVFSSENLLTISAPSSKMGEIMTRIAEIDTPPRQVYIEARIVEIQRDSIRDLGIQWGGFSTYSTNQTFPNVVGIGGGSGGIGMQNSPAISLPPSGSVDPSTGQVANNPQGAAIGITLGNVAGTIQLHARLFALEEAGLSRTLSNPKVVAINGVLATISSGREIPYQSSSANLGTTVQFRDAVISLSVTPRIMDDNRVRLTILVKKDEVDPALSVGGVPAIKKKMISTKVIVENGGSTVLGGVFEGEEGSFQERIPWFHKIPVIGWLFKNERKVKNELELLVFITPTILAEGQIR